MRRDRTVTNAERAMWLVCSMHKVDCRDLIDKPKSNFDKSFQADVEFSLANPPYTILGHHASKKSYIESVKEDDVNKSISFSSETQGHGSNS